MSFVERNPDGTRRWCDKCKAYQPDRAHHCSVCRKCTLMMDHHSFVFGTCIGYSNYKLYFLATVYASLMFLIGAVILLSAPASYEDEYGRWVTYPRWLLGLSDLLLSSVLMAYTMQHFRRMQLGVTTFEDIEKVKTKDLAFQLAMVKYRRRSIWRLCMGYYMWQWWMPYFRSFRSKDRGLFLRPIHRRSRSSQSGRRGSDRRGSGRHGSGQKLIGRA